MMIDPYTEGRIGHLMFHLQSSDWLFPEYSKLFIIDFIAGVSKTENGIIQAGDRPDNYWLVAVIV